LLDARDDSGNTALIYAAAKAVFETRAAAGAGRFHGKKPWENHGKMVITVERSTIFNG